MLSSVTYFSLLALFRPFRKNNFRRKPPDISNSGSCDTAEQIYGSVETVKTKLTTRKEYPKSVVLSIYDVRASANQVTAK